MKTPVFIPYEIKSREHDGKLLLISHLLNAGYKEIYFGSRGGVFKEALSNKNGIIFLKSINVEKKELYKSLKKLNHKLVLIHVEGGVYHKHSILSLYNEDLLNIIDIDFTFGQHLKYFINLFYGDKFDKNTIVSGEPRFELFKNKYHPFFGEKVKEIKNKYNSFILINTNFTTVNPFIGKENYLNAIHNDKTINVDFKQKKIESIPIINKIMMSYIESVKELAKEFPKKKFILRPHPGESTDIYINSFKKINNIFVIKEGNSAEWIIASEGVIHHDCTTGIESFIAEKPVISYLPLKESNRFQLLPIEISNKVYDLDNLKIVINKIFNGQYKYQISKESYNMLKENFHNIDVDSNNIIINKLLELTKSIDANMKITKSTSIYDNRLFSFIRYYANYILNINKFSKFKKSHKYVDLQKTEVIKKLIILNDINEFKFKFKIKKVRPDVVKIQLS